MLLLLQPPVARSRASILPVVLAAVIAFAAGALLTLGGVAVQRWLVNDTTPISLADVVASDFQFAGSVPDSAACADPAGYVDAVIGDGVALFQFRSVDVARQYATYGGVDADFYRSDQFVADFDGTLRADGRYSFLQGLESIATNSDAD